MRSAVVFGISKFATHDGPGIRTVVFVKGCPLRCTWCHSPESWNPKVEKYPDGTVIGREMTSAEVVEEVLKDRDFYDASGGGITISGGEPLMRWEFTAETLRAAKAAGLDTALETSGYGPKAAIDALAPFVDTWLYDIKGLDPERHRKNTGVPTDVIQANLRRLDAERRHIVLRCPMVPGLNDREQDLAALGRLADSLRSAERIDVEPYVPYGIDKARKLGLKVYEAPQPPPEYAGEIIDRLSRFTSKTVVKG